MVTLGLFDERIHLDPAGFAGLQLSNMAAPSDTGRVEMCMRFSNIKLLSKCTLVKRKFITFVLKFISLIWLKKKKSPVRNLP